MSKLIRFVLVAMLLIGAVALFQPQVAEAQTKFPSYVSGIQVANLSNSVATVVLTAYRESDGAQDGSPLSDTIPVNGSKTFFPITNVSVGFKGSFVISSNQNIAAISNILSSDYSAGASYVGRSAGSTTVLLPLLNKNNSGYTTWFSVQNTSPSTPAHITIDYSSNLADVTATIPPNASKTFYQELEGHNQAVFAATVTSDQPIVASAIQESSDVMFAYTGFAGGVTEPVFPLVNANNRGYVSGLQIQNAGNANTTVTVSYTPSPGSDNGSACTETQTIAPGASNTFALKAFNQSESGENCADKVRFVGSAKVTANSANQPLVGVGNQLLPGTNGGAYVSFSPSDAGQVVTMPLIMDRNGGYFTGFNVQNIGSSATTVTCTYSNSSVTDSGTLQPNEALNVLQLNRLTAGYVGAATCTGGAGALLVAVVNELRPSDSDNFLVYEGVKR